MADSKFNFDELMKGGAVDTLNQMGNLGRIAQIPNYAMPSSGLPQQSQPTSPIDQADNLGRIAQIPPYAQPSTGQRPQAEGITGTLDQMSNLGRIAQIPLYAQPTSGLPQQSQLPPLTPQPINGMPNQQMGPMPTTQLPNGGTANAPFGVAENVEAMRNLLPTPAQELDSRGYTPEEARRVDQELKIDEAKQGIGVRTITNSLVKQGMDIPDIAKAIGYKEGMTKGDALKALQGLQKKKQTQGENSKSARETAKIAGRDDPDTQRWNGIEDTFSQTGNDPLGKPLYDLMDKQQQKEYGRLRTKIADGRARENDIARMELLGERLLKKSDKAKATREAKEKQNVLRTASRKAKTAEDKLWLDSQSKEIGILDKRIEQYLGASDKEKAALMTPDQHRNDLDRRGELLATIQSYNKGNAVTNVAPQGDQPAKPQAFNSVEEAETANLDAGTPVIIGGRPAVIR